MALLMKRTVMTLYSDDNDPYSHQARIVLAEKGVNVEIHHIDPEAVPQDLIDVNPQQTLPTLVDRELIIDNTRIILEYLDERFPYPPLLPVYPVSRAESRKILHKIHEDWYQLMHIIMDESTPELQAESKQQLWDSLLSAVPIFSSKPYFLNEEFTLVDCCLAPLLWRLPQMGLDAAALPKPIQEYMKRLFDRASFQNSLSKTEKTLQAA